MAEKDPAFEPPPGPGQRFPDEWFDGDWWCIKQGPDFQMTMRSFRACYGRAARTRGLYPKTVPVGEETVMVRALKARLNGKG